MRRTVGLSALLITLALPAFAQTASAPQITLTLPLDGATVTSQTFKCGEGQPFPVQYINAGANMLALLPVDGDQRIFTNVIAASGARYTSGQYEWWTKGDTATLTDAMDADHPQDCTTVE
ncbi:MAG: lysozyme inhibitor [Paracoccus denitrificans]|nr:MAG: lysozyme inhibitor [Paracoccus denitrificans]PZO86034.1 MAG: lysozyme inhibitor [Paracoccus denitrificans]